MIYDLLRQSNGHAAIDSKLGRGPNQALFAASDANIAALQLFFAGRRPNKRHR